MKLKSTIFSIISAVFMLSGLLMTQHLDAQDKRFALKTVVIDAGHGGKDPG